MDSQTILTIIATGILFSGVLWTVPEKVDNENLNCLIERKGYRNGKKTKTIHTGTDRDTI